MCNSQRAALDMLCATDDHGGLSPTALMLHKKQCEDFEKMQKEIDTIKADVSEMKADVSCVRSDVSDVKKQISELKTIFEERGSFIQTLKEVLNNKNFIKLLLIIISALFSLSLTELAEFMGK